MEMKSVQGTATPCFRQTVNPSMGARLKQGVAIPSK